MPCAQGPTCPQQDTNCTSYLPLCDCNCREVLYALLSMLDLLGCSTALAASCLSHLTCGTTMSRMLDCLPLPEANIDEKPGRATAGGKEAAYVESTCLASWRGMNVTFNWAPGRCYGMIRSVCHRLTCHRSNLYRPLESSSLSTHWQQAPWQVQRKQGFRSNDCALLMMALARSCLMGKQLLHQPPQQTLATGMHNAMA